MKIDYDQTLFEPVDEILVMQQHSGGENLVVYKGQLKAQGQLNIFEIVEKMNIVDFSLCRYVYFCFVSSSKLSIWFNTLCQRFIR